MMAKVISDFKQQIEFHVPLLIATKIKRGREIGIQSDTD